MLRAKFIRCLFEIYSKEISPEKFYNFDKRIIKFRQTLLKL